MRPPKISSNIAPFLDFTEFQLSMRCMNWAKTYSHDQPNYFILIQIQGRASGSIIHYAMLSKQNWTTHCPILICHYHTAVSNLEKRSLWINTTMRFTATWQDAGIHAIFLNYGISSVRTNNQPLLWPILVLLAYWIQWIRCRGCMANIHWAIHDNKYIYLLLQCRTLVAW